jgi:hypothetical protein
LDGLQNITVKELLNVMLGIASGMAHVRQIKRVSFHTVSFLISFDVLFF